MAVGADGRIIGPSYNLLHVEPQSFTIDSPGGVAGGVFLQLEAIQRESCVGSATIQLLDR